MGRGKVQLSLGMPACAPEGMCKCLPLTIMGKCVSSPPGTQDSQCFRVCLFVMGVYILMWVGSCILGRSVIHLSACACRGQRLTLGIFLHQCCASLFTQAGSLTEPGACPFGQCSQAACSQLSLPLEHWIPDGLLQLPAF